jgi:hypothetical protein
MRPNDNWTDTASKTCSTSLNLSACDPLRTQLQICFTGTIGSDVNMSEAADERETATVPGT